MSRIEVILRLVTGFSLVLAVAASGVLGQTPWIIGPFTIVFTLLYWLGKNAAIQAWRTQGWSAVARALPVILLVQAILCAVFYLIGRGIGNLLRHPVQAEFTRLDWALPLGLLGLGIANHGLLSYLSARKQAESNNESDKMSYRSEWVLELDPKPVTLENFYDGFFYGHRKYGENGELGDQVSEAARTSPEMIEAAESRLNIAFPRLLRQLYERQNGGMAYNLWVPAVPKPTAELDDWRGVFSHDYCYLAPLDKLDTLHDSYLDFMDEDEIAQDDRVPKQAKRYIVLCQRYQDTTFLDYSDSRDNPRVGIVDFEGIDKKNVWFDSFDDFFSALRRGDLAERGSAGR